MQGQVFGQVFEQVFENARLFMRIDGIDYDVTMTAAAGTAGVSRVDNPPPADWTRGWDEAQHKEEIEDRVWIRERMEWERLCWSWARYWRPVGPKPLPFRAVGRATSPARIRRPRIKSRQRREWRPRGRRGQA